MELGKVIFSNHANGQFEELAVILFSKQYFSFKETANNYVDKIYSFIEKEIHTFPH